MAVQPPADLSLSDLQPQRLIDHPSVGKPGWKIRILVDDILSNPDDGVESEIAAAVPPTQASWRPSRA